MADMAENIPVAMTLLWFSVDHSSSSPTEGLAATEGEDVS